MSKKDVDLTTSTGAETDVARIGRNDTPPPHEQTADEDIDVVDWSRLASSNNFALLVESKARFLVPAKIIFMTYYFTLLVLVGFFPEVMSRTVPGLEPVNFAYLFALSQFAMVGLVTWAYLRHAKRQDALASKIRSAAIVDRGDQMI